MAPIFQHKINEHHTVSLVKGIDGYIEDSSVYTYTSPVAKDYEGDDVKMIFKGITDAVSVSQNSDNSFTLKVNR